MVSSVLQDVHPQLQPPLFLFFTLREKVRILYKTARPTMIKIRNTSAMINSSQSQKGSDLENKDRQDKGKHGIECH
jgi:hypothetical protein